MKYVRFLLLCLLLVVLPITQTAASTAQCPNLTLHGPFEVTEGASLSFSANVTKAPANITPTYNWTVSAGSISSGQGTSVITVDTTGLGNQTVTATVDLGGFDRSCSVVASHTASVMKKPEARKLDEFGAIKAVDEKPRLEAFAIEIMNDPTATGYLLVYGGQKQSAKALDAAIKRTRDYLVKQLRMDGARVISVKGGQREAFTIELWLVPTGAQPPEANPPASSGATAPAKVKPKAKKSKKS